MKTFSEDFIDAFKARKADVKIHYMADIISKILTEYVKKNADELEKQLELHFQDPDIDERDIAFALSLAGYFSNKERVLKKIFDLALDKKKFSYSKEYKDYLMQHFTKREKPVFEKYLRRALDPTSPLLVSTDHAKYIAKRIITSKVELTKSQANYLLHALGKINIKAESQYIVYLKTLDYLGRFSHVGHTIFEKKFNDLYGGKSPNYTHTTPDTIIKVLNACTESTLKYRLAKVFLLPPYDNNKYIKKGCL